MSDRVKWFNWVRYSGAVITLHLNPLYWWAVPYFKQVENEFGEQDRRWEFKFLCLKLTVWLDNGEW